MSPAVASLLSQEDLESFRRDGFLVVRGLLSRDEAAVIRDTFMEMNKNGPVPNVGRLRNSTSVAAQVAHGLSDLPYRDAPKKKLNIWRWSVVAEARGKAKSKASGAGPMAGTLMRKPKPGATRN